ncbi:MAG: zf-HC2 domain-containing protein [Clostridia bacterium]|nr:zf-HC2 domain-containing protein [Clostridia bacterium]
MTCAEIDAMLDRLMDDELTGEERQALQAHGQTCPACAAAIRSTLQMKALFAEMEPEVDVPLEAQAKWRGAVRQASRQQNRRRLTRWIGSAAAAVVVLAGVGLALNAGRNARTDRTQPVKAEYAVNREAQQPDATMEIYDAAEAPMPLIDESVAAGGAAERAAGSASMELEMADDAGEYAVMAPPAAALSEDAIIEADGESAPMCAALAQRAPACELRLRVAALDDACGLIGDLAAEYEGYADVQRLEDGGANVYVEVPASDAGEFLDALAPIGEISGERKLPDATEKGTVLVLLVVDSEN